MSITYPLCATATASHMPNNLKKKKRKKQQDL